MEDKRLREWVIDSKLLTDDTRDGTINIFF